MQAKSNQAKSNTSKMSFSSPDFAKAVEGLNNRANNFNTSTQRSKTIGMDDFNKSQRSAVDTSNYALSTNPLVQRSQFEDSRNFREDSRRFDAGLNFKTGADVRANETQRFGIGAQLEGLKYGADAGVRTAGIGADAAKYGADKGLESTRLGANAQLGAAKLGADAARYSALLGAGSASLNSQQYRPTFNR